jgi:hypothetical protein
LSPDGTFHLAAKATDAAGNSSACSSDLDVVIDTAAPTVTVTGVTDGSTYDPSSVPTAGCNTTDGGSGVDTSATVNVSPLPVDDLGNHTATCSGATDKAGNAANNAQATYNVSVTPVCTNVTVSSTASVTWKPSATRASTKTVRIRVTNNTGSLLTITGRTLDVLKLPTPPYTIVGGTSLPKTVKNGRGRTITVRIRKAAGTGEATVARTYVNLALSCGTIAASEPVDAVTALRAQPFRFDGLSIDAKGAIRLVAKGQGIDSLRLQLFDLRGQLLVDETRQDARAMTLPMIAKTGQTLARGVYLYVVTVRGVKGEIAHTKVEKLVILE